MNAEKGHSQSADNSQLLAQKAARRADMPDDPHTTNGMIVEQI